MFDPLLGQTRIGMANSPILTFFGVDDLQSRHKHASFAVQQDFDRYLLDAILSKSSSWLQALNWGVLWGDAVIVHRELQRIVDEDGEDVDSDTLAHALTEAIISCVHDSSAANLECVQTLLSFGADPRHLELDDIFSYELCKYAPPMLMLLLYSSKPMPRVMIAHWPSLC